MKRTLTAAALAVSVMTLVVIAGATAAQPARWSPQPDVGFKTLTAPSEQVDAIALGAIDTPQPTPTATATTTPSPRPTQSKPALARLGPVAQAQKSVAVQPVKRAPPAPTRAPARPPTSRVPSVAAAQAYALSQIGSTQYSCLYKLWRKESSWNPYAQNRTSGAYGIPQALPGIKMASAGSDWRTNPVTQVKWGLGYIRAVYGTACAAWNHSQTHGWY